MFVQGKQVSGNIVRIMNNGQTDCNFRNFENLSDYLYEPSLTNTDFNNNAGMAHWSEY